MLYKERIIAPGSVLRTKEENGEGKKKKRGMGEDGEENKKEDEGGCSTTIDGTSDWSGKLVRSSSTRDLTSTPSK